MDIWHHFVGEKPHANVLGLLSQERLTLNSSSSFPDNGPGVVFFKEVSKELVDVVHEASKRGAERVLAIAIPGARLEPSEVWSLLAAGASDAFAWDHHPPDPAREIAARFERWSEVDSIVQSSLVKDNLAGKSPVWIRSLRQIVEVAKFTNSSVLITGESGTGKELFAQLVHTLDSRNDKGSLVVCDCTTLVPDLAGSEFFGHERGAFTGAVSAREGAFGLANGGTLFLDEVGELPLNLQAELLRVTQEHTYKRVGGNQWRNTDFRLVCATNRNLVEEQASGRFRRDFYYRIASWNCHLPPLAERREDIPVLTRHFIEKLCPDNPPETDPAVMQFLATRDYPGNVRELKQLVSRIVRHHVGPGPLTAGDIPEDARPCSVDQLTFWDQEALENAIRSAIAAGVSLKEIKHTAGEVAERIVIEEEQGNLQRAAMRLGITDRSLQMRRAARRQNGNGEIVKL
jgi:transcriptional regulator with GAF, ATPase, and Fis domain